MCAYLGISANVIQSSTFRWNTLVILIHINKLINLKDVYLKAWKRKPKITMNWKFKKTRELEKEEKEEKNEKTKSGVE